MIQCSVKLRLKITICCCYLNLEKKLKQVVHTDLGLHESVYTCLRLEFHWSIAMRSTSSKFSPESSLARLAFAYLYAWLISDPKESNYLPVQYQLNSVLLQEPPHHWLVKILI